MAKISPVSIKYIIHANLELTGVADRPDIIGAVFGQTEGLLGSDLELRELQKSGRIGRIDVKIDTKGGRTSGEILLPSSMGKAETAIIAASLETIERVGPCDAKIKVTKVEDVRVSKRNMIIERAKQLLAAMMTEMPDSQALTQVITEDVRTLEVTEYGKDRLPAGPSVDSEEEIILVEGRADVITLLRYGIKNVVAMKGAKPSETVIELTKTKTVTVFVDGDRGGDLILKGLVDAGAEIDFVAKAQDGKEVEELTMKEILKSLRGKIAWEQLKGEYKSGENTHHVTLPKISNGEEEVDESPRAQVSRMQAIPTTQTSRFEERRPAPSSSAPSNVNLKSLKPMAEELVGTRGAILLNDKLSVLGRVPVKELEETLQNLDGVYAIVMDGSVEAKLARTADDKDVKYIISPSATARPRKAKLITPNTL
ncbi:MAG: DNA primase DnaG [Nanoarchaeota archaeon]|mgnify:FL=1